ncbi:class E sortase [Kitasatospora sp. NPDC086791]|uniref:class E sortase n=1 Tax=Kitasatospora sp. NPDC086791 TaxID=3155178 RepID=UPI003430EC18
MDHAAYGTDPAGEAHDRGAPAGDPRPGPGRRPRTLTPRPSPRGCTSAALGITGELLLTLGLVFALFIVYSLWWTGIVADTSAAQAATRLRRTWTAGPTDTPGTATAADGTTNDPADPDGIGFLHIPAMGRDFQVLIRMGTDNETLSQGVAGVYERPYRSAMPWDEHGNFALAAHRDGHGAKFHDLDALTRGDAIVVETRNNWYVYRVDSLLPQTSKYDTDITAPVPKESGYGSPGRYITLTTCTPVYTSRYRMAVRGSLARIDPMNQRRTPPPELRHT